MKDFAEIAGAGLVFVFWLMWTLGGFVGMVYWATQDYLLGVVLSFIIPMYGAISVLIDVLS